MEHVKRRTESCCCVFNVVILLANASLIFLSLADGKAPKKLKHQKSMFKPLQSNPDDNIIIIRYSARVHAVIVIVLLN